LELVLHGAQNFLINEIHEVTFEITEEWKYYVVGMRLEITHISLSSLLFITLMLVWVLSSKKQDFFIHHLLERGI
jgi:hypothetical protein